MCWGEEGAGGTEGGLALGTVGGRDQKGQRQRERAGERERESEWKEHTQHDRDYKLTLPHYYLPRALTRLYNN